MLVLYGVQLETEQAIVEQSNTTLSWLLEKYWDDARKTIYDYDTEWEKYKNVPKKIVVHHTAGETCNPVQISKQHRDDPKKWTQWYNTSQKTILPRGIIHPEEMERSDVRYHYIVQADWSTDEVRYEDEVGRWTRVNNIDVLHIAFCGNFNDHEPTKEQYKAWGELITKIRSKYGDLKVYSHWELAWEATACPGKLFNYDALSFYTPISKPVKEVVSNEWLVVVKQDSLPKADCKDKPWMKCLWLFDEITAYYSPVENQWRYFAPDGKTQRTYQQEVKVNGDLTPANGMLYIDEHKFSHGACGYDLLRKKLWIEWWSETHGVFTCVDRGSAIDANDIDIWYWIGRQALNMIDGKDDKSKQVHHPFQAMVYLVE